MALKSIKQYTGNGSTTDYLFDIPYIKAVDVHGFVDATEVAITFVDSTHVRFTVTPVDQSKIEIRRLSDASTIRHTFPDTTHINSTRLDGNSIHQLYLIEEQQDLTEGFQIAEESATQAAASAAAALISEGLADADAIQTALDRIATGNDASQTAADEVNTNQDALDTASDLVATNQDTIDTAADLVQTNQDTLDTAADLVAAQTLLANVGSLLGINYGAFTLLDGELSVTHLTTSTPSLVDGELILDYETL